MMILQLSFKQDFAAKHVLLGRTCRVIVFCVGLVALQKEPKKFSLPNSTIYHNH